MMGKKIYKKKKKKKTLILFSLTSPC